MTASPNNLRENHVVGCERSFGNGFTKTCKHVLAFACANARSSPVLANRPIVVPSPNPNRGNFIVASSWYQMLGYPTCNTLSSTPIYLNVLAT
jgi:hypothetical protein